MKQSENKNVISRRKQFKSFLFDLEIPLVVVIGLVGLTLSTLGFRQYYQGVGQPYTWRDCIFQAVQLLSLNSGAVPPDGPVPWMLEVGRILTPLVTFYAIIKTLLAVFRDSWHLLRIRFLGNHQIVCGLGRKGLLLAREWRENGKAVVIIERDPANVFLGEARALGCKVVIGDAREDLTLEKAGLRRAASIVVVCGEDKINAEIASRLRRLLAGRQGKPLTCITQIEDTRLWVLLREMELSTNGHDSMRLEFFNVYENAAYILAERYLMPEKLGGEPSVLVVGLGSLGEALVVNAARNWARHFRQTGQKIRILALDVNARQACAALQERFHLVRDAAELVPLEMDIQSAEFHCADFLWKGEKICAINQVVVCLEDESAGMNAGLSLRQQIDDPQVQVVVTQWEDAGFAELMQKSDQSQPQMGGITIFGLLNHTCKEGLLDDGTHERLARAIHRVYRRNFSLPVGEAREGSAHFDWEDPQLQEGYRESNRHQADDIGRKLAALGYRIRPWTELGALDFRLDEETEVDPLARQEHERWMAERISQGWRYGERRDNVLKLHPDLLDWNDPCFTRLAKDKDANTVRNIPDYLLEAGFQLEKISKTGH